MIKANVILDKIIWKKKIQNPNYYIKKKLNKLHQKFKLASKKQEFSILLTNNKKMKELNTKFRKNNKPTDVLSFPLNTTKNNKGYLGDLAISYEIVNKRSKYSNFHTEFDKMWIHGYLHLIGFDHKKNEDFKKMYKLENNILNYFENKNY